MTLKVQGHENETGDENRREMPTQSGKMERDRGNQRELEAWHAGGWGGGWLGHVGNTTGQADSPRGKAQESGIRCQTLCKTEMSHRTDVQGEIGNCGSYPHVHSPETSPKPYNNTYSLGEKTTKGQIQRNEWKSAYSTEKHRNASSLPPAHSPTWLPNTVSQTYISFAQEPRSAFFRANG